MEEAMSKRKIPQTDSIQELAQFWDTHDLADYDDELEEVVETVFERERVVKVELPSHEAEMLESLARSRGLDTAKLIREWVLEKMRKTA
jgi:hypothetical protein